ncbi:beta-defensin 114 [Ursus americanus]|uniref:Beta-defensin n=1 Tax=Ursus maritimus TaxID=29073 RepID=A0A8M1GUH1_URSMA|nr:beta-defensin 114 [Ursus maritimus]XP_045660669.1 beta-defensin 114 [Ursus americanus]
MTVVEVWENVLNYLMKSFETGDKTLVFRPWKISNVSYSSFTVATCSLVDPDRCTKIFGYCRRRCFKYEKQIDVCLSPSKICCIERLFEED